MMKFKIFLINLDDSTDRLSKAKSQFENLSLEFEKISAVMGKALSTEELSKNYSAELNRKHYFVPLSFGEIGCYMSHLKACRKLVADDLDYAIILEDDVVLTEKFKLIPAALESIKFPWNYIKLISYGKEKRIKTRTHICNSTLADASFAFDLLTWEKPPIGTAAYAITKEGAKEFLAKRSTFFRPIDVDLQYPWETNLNVTGLSPQCVTLLEDKSTIQQQKKRKYHYPFARTFYKIRYALAKRAN